MKLILHIGMGKTGSSSIQLALSKNTEKLRAQKARYLGMWFDMIDPAFQGISNQGKFFHQSADTIREQARGFCGVIRERAQVEGTDIFIMSNEAFSGHSHALVPFVEEVVMQGIEVRAIGYARNPRSWLPSAYVQWGIRDKINEGPVQTYETKARVLVNWYKGLIDWSDCMGKLIEIRHYDAVGDIVIDFAQAAGIHLDVPERRSYERGDDSEILLRALFNNRFPQTVLPMFFDRAVIGKSQEYPTMEEAISRYFDYGATDRIIEENRELFVRFRDHCGIDLLQNAPDLPGNLSMEEFRNRLFDYLVEITLDQARRINHLEREVTDIKGLMK